MLEYAKHMREVYLESLESTSSDEDSKALMYWTQRLRELRSEAIHATV